MLSRCQTSKLTTGFFIKGSSWEESLEGEFTSWNVHTLETVWSQQTLHQIASVIWDSRNCAPRTWRQVCFRRHHGDAKSERVNFERHDVGVCYVLPRSVTCLHEPLRSSLMASGVPGQQACVTQGATPGGWDLPSWPGLCSPGPFLS